MFLTICDAHSPILYVYLFHTTLNWLSLYLRHPQSYSLCLSLYLTPIVLFFISLSLTPSSLCLSHTNLQWLSNSDTHSPVHYRSFSLKLTLFLSLSLSDTHLHSPILEVSLAATYLKLSLHRSYTYSVSFFYSLCELLPCKPILSCALPLTHTVSNTYSQLSLHLSYVYAVSSSLSQVYYYLCFLVHSHNR